MTSGKYILDANGQPQVEPDLMKWARWFETAESVVCQEWIGDSRVSTVFLGLDHNWAAEGPPILWETMVFNSRLNGQMDRCAGTREQAEAMHQQMIEKVKATNAPAAP